MKKPAIRFKTFSDEWTEKIFSQLYQKTGKKNDLTYGEKDIISVANMYFKPCSNITDEKYLLTYNIFELGDIAFEGNKSNHFAHGRFVENTIGNGIVSHVFDVFRPIMSPYDLLFWKYAINNEALMGSILLRSTKASTMMTNLVANDFLQEKIVIPTYAEQRKIGAFLNEIDRLITYYQNRLEKIEMLKSSMLEKMFPKDGADVPEVRFKEFDGAWERHKVGDFLTESRIVGHTGQDAKKLTVKLWGKGVVEKTDIFSGSVHTQYYIRKNGQFMYGKLDFLHAAFGIVPPYLDGYESTLDSPAFDLFNIDGQFLMNTVTQENFYLKNGIIANGSRKAKRIHVDTFLEMDILTPRIEEQVKIGGYFLQIDNLIISVQQELNKLQSIKKALLEKMFV